MNSSVVCKLNDWQLNFFDDKIVCRPTQQSISRHVNGMWLGVAFIAIVGAVVCGSVWDWLGGEPAEPQAVQQSTYPRKPQSSMTKPRTDEQAIKRMTESLLSDLPPDRRAEVERKRQLDREDRQERRRALSKQRTWLGWVKIALIVGLGIPITGVLLMGAGNMVYQGFVELNRPGNDAYTISVRKAPSDSKKVQLRIQRPGSGRWAAGIDQIRTVTSDDRLRCRTHYTPRRGTGESSTPESWQWIVILDGGPGVSKGRWSFQLAKQRSQPTTDDGPPPNVQRFANWMSHQTQLPVSYSF